MAAIQYNRIIRKIVVGFGDLFNNITLVRYDSNQVEKERFLIPIAYASKERYVMRLEDDPNLDKKVQMALPRLSFEMTGLDAKQVIILIGVDTANFCQTLVVKEDELEVHRQELLKYIAAYKNKNNLLLA